MPEYPIYDVFLVHHPHDDGVAAMVIREFEQAGCGVYPQLTTPVNLVDGIQMPVMDALVDSSAMVLLLTRTSVESRWFAFAVGVAMAWDKPVVVLHDGIELRSIPEFLNQFQLVPLSNLDRVVQQVQLLRKPLTDSQRDSLASAYRELGVPADQLLLDVKQRRKLASLFSEHEKETVPVNRLLQELIRLRKQGELPKQRKVSDVVTAG